MTKRSTKQKKIVEPLPRWAVVVLKKNVTFSQCRFIGTLEDNHESSAMSMPCICGRLQEMQEGKKKKRK